MKRYLLTTFCLLLAPLTGFGQGALNPPSGPAPTMRTLDQVEPRTPIDAAHTPGDADNEYVIGAPGSYYLTANLGVRKTTGIRVNASEVTIDLNGFHVSRVEGAAGTGISGGGGLTLKNGSVSGFGTGVLSGGSGLFLHLAVSNCSDRGIAVGSSSRIENCAASGIKGNGIVAGPGSTLMNCTVSTSSGPADAAIEADDASTLVNCTARNNSADYGIKAGSGATLINCTARDNTSDAALSAGITTGIHSTVIGCAATRNTSTATATGLTGAGFLIAEGTLVKDCSASFNRGDGIYFENACTIVGNVASANGFQAGVGSGLHSAGDRSRIQNNNVTSNDTGIRVTGSATLVDGNHVRSHTGPGIQVTMANAKNIIIRNVAGENVNSYSNIASGNQVGPVDTNFSATSPFANFLN